VRLGAATVTQRRSFPPPPTLAHPVPPQREVGGPLLPGVYCERVREVTPRAAPAKYATLIATDDFSVTPRVIVEPWTAGPRRADLIIIGSGDYSGLADLPLGSIAHKVISLAPCLPSSYVDFSNQIRSQRPVSSSRRSSSIPLKSKRETIPTTLPPSTIGTWR